MKLTEKDDHQRFLVPDGDPGFNPERNREVIAKSIEKYEAKRKREQELYRDKLGERSDAVASFLKRKANSTMEKSVEDYFGRQELARLRGQQILNQLRRDGGVITLN